MERDGLKQSRIAVYARYSSDQQREASIDDQVRHCREFLERNGGTFRADLCFTDAAISGASLKRPGFEALMAAAKAHAIDTIVVEDVSRLSRDSADSAVVFRELRFLGVQLLGVNDGIDSSEASSKVTFTVKSLANEMYIDDLRARTLRGLEGRAKAGYSTGLLPYGYRSRPEAGPHGHVVGYRIEIDREEATIVLRIFVEYLNGRSLRDIALGLSRDRVAAPRAGSRHRHQGWGDSTIRVILRNRKYIGDWSFKNRQWKKDPGTNRRRPSLRPDSEILTMTWPDLRIVPAEIAEAVERRLASVYAFYTRRPDGSPKGKAVPGRATPYLLSGLLTCAACGSLMVIRGGSSTQYYRCAGERKGSCGNALSLREDVARSRILEAIGDRLSSKWAVAYIAKRASEVAAKGANTRSDELRDARSGLTATENRIRRLVRLLADGEGSEYVLDEKRRLEQEARQLSAKVTALEGFAADPPPVPDVQSLVDLALDIEARLMEDVTAGRERLRHWLRDGRILLEAQDGAYVARSEVFPLLIAVQKKAPLRRSEGALSSAGSGGRI